MPRKRQKAAAARKKPKSPETGVRRLRKHFVEIRRLLLAWFDRNQRDYPWRKTGNWFHLLMAEMMLRRTRADQVLSVYRKFLKIGSSPARASRIKKKNLLKMMHPLGLRWRAEQLIKTIDYLKDSFNLRAPESTDDLQKIPGVGSYSDAMLRNRLFGERIAAVDSNVVRLLCATGRVQSKSTFSPGTRLKFSPNPWPTSVKKRSIAKL